ncbi:MAG: OmpA family protein [Bacteroidota bacterium]|nr:OmpA family protein [Bacteroidota bacterium]
MKKLTLLAFVFGFFAASAQDSSQTDSDANADSPDGKNYKYQSWSVGVDFGQSSFFGDLYSFEARQQDYNSDFGGFGQFGAGVTLAKWINTYIGFEGQFAWQQISGSYKEYGFESTMLRPSINVLLNLTGAGGPNLERQRKSAWIASAGIGLALTKGTGYILGGDANGGLQFDITNAGRPQFFVDESTANSYQKTFIIPVGIQWRYRFAPSWDLKVGTQATIFFSDEIDASGAFMDYADNPNNPVPTSNIQSRAADVALYTSVGVDWYFGWKKGSSKKEPIAYQNPFLELSDRLAAVENDVDNLKTDDDKDGVSDYFDKDKNTPEGVAVTGNGSAVDTDGDGVPDYMDEDPYSSRGAKVDADGREMDSDGDGVPDGRDAEPNTPRGQLVNFQGRSIDLKDAYYLPNVFFAFNSATVSAANEERLARIAELMKKHPEWKMKVVGHADKVGSESYNKNLSERRAQAVVKKLTQVYGIEEGRFIAEGKGESEELGTSNNVNRRVEFIIMD